MLKAAFLQVKFWKSYYASSPHRYFFTNGSYKGSEAEIDLFCIDSAADIEDVGLEKYDFIITDQGLSYNPAITKHKAVKFFLALDVHAWDAAAWKSFNDAVEATNYTLTQYPFAKFPDYVPLHPWKTPCAKEKFLLFPHHVADENIYSGDLSENRARFLLSGSRGRPTYDFRADIEHYVNQLGDQGVIDILNNKDDLKHETYLDHLRNYIGAITCNSTFDYTVSKYTEIPSQGTILFAKEIPKVEAEILGLEHGKNCFLTKLWPKTVALIDAVSNYPKMYHSVALAGRDLIRNRHTTSRRYRLLELLMKEHSDKGSISFDRGVELLKESYLK